MDNTLRKALWEILRPLLQLITNLLNPEIGEEWLKEFKKFLRKEQTWVPEVTAEKEIVLPKTRVARTMTLGSLIKAGKYGFVDSDITEANFPMPEGFTLGTEPKLFHFNPSISSENAILEMKKKGYRPATIWDLLNFGAKNPELQEQFPIVALGSATLIVDRRYVAYIHRSGKGPYIELFWFGREWDDDFRFLAVRK